MDIASDDEHGGEAQKFGSMQLVALASETAKRLIFLQMTLPMSRGAF
jgi:hypothetical protein